MPNTTREIIEAMDYSGGIDWNKMLPPEDESYNDLWYSQLEVDELCETHRSIFDKELRLRFEKLQKELQEKMYDFMSFNGYDNVDIALAKRDMIDSVFNGHLKRE